MHLNALDAEKQLIDIELKMCFNNETPDSLKLQEAIAYTLQLQGKRIRPILTLLTAEMLGTPNSIAKRPACALELIHTYSMIHDDLPCMDDDDYRRGQATLHKAFNEATAVLIGDLLLTKAFEVIATSPGISPLQAIDLTKVLARASGATGMLDGQMLDLAAEGRSISQEELEILHSKKTGALITAALDFGAILGKAKPETTETLKKFGISLGLAFQVADDIIDVTNSSAKHGKEQSSDQRNEKSTYVSLIGLEKSREILKDLENRMEHQLATLPYDSSRLLSLMRFVCTRTY